MEWAATLISRSIESLIESGEVSTLTQWVKHLPRKHIRQRPRLALAYAWGLIASHQLDDARFWVEEVQQSLNAHEKEQRQPPPPNSDESLPQPSHGELALVRSMLALASGDFQQATEYSREAAGYLEQGNPFIRSMLALEESMHCILLGDTSKAIEALQETAAVARRANNLFVLIVTTSQLAEMQMLQGRLSQAFVTLQKARLLVVGSDEKPLALAGIIDHGLGEILRERNNLEEAREYLERGRHLTQTEWAQSSLEAVVSLARLLQSQGEITESELLIAEAYRLALSGESGQ